MYKLTFLLYFLGVVYISTLREVELLLFLWAFLFVALLLKRRKILQSIKMLSFPFVFTAVVSLPYALWNGSVDYTLMLLLRVLSIHTLTLLFLSTVNLYASLSFSKTLSSLLVLAIGFSITYRRALQNFLQALKSRSPHKPERDELLQFTRRVVEYFFNLSIKDGKEVSMAMKSRGFYFD